MRKILFLLLFFPLWCFGQDDFQLTGYVEDISTGERLIGATLVETSSGVGAVSNAYGFFSMSLPRGKQKLEVRFVGYQNNRLFVNLQQDSLIFISLDPGVSLDEVVVKAAAPKETHRELSSLTYQRLNMAQIDRIPVVLGERDILKSLQYLPGVKGGRENTTTYNVRGGSADQNLILLDGVPVYNVSHVFGFFSTFNNDAIKGASFYKGGIPARYGGRLSSVLDVTMKEGNLKRNSGVFSISPISARFTLEEPIKQDTASWLFSVRRSFLDLPLWLYQNLSGLDQTYGFKFYDLNMKANWIINERNRLYVSMYTGRDRQFHRSKDEEGITDKNHYQWGNLTGVARWNKILSPRLFSNFSAYFSRYKFAIKGKSDDGSTKSLFESSSKLWDYSLKADLEYYAGKSYLSRLGGKVSHLVFKPNIIQIVNQEYDITMNDEYSKQANSIEGYQENEFQFGRLNMNAGIRFSAYFADGKKYLDWQPRLGIGLDLGNGYQLSTSYMRMTQYIHQLSNSSLGMPTDLWVASTGNVRPEVGEQVALGIERRFNSTYKAGIEAYYKTMDHVIRFQEGETFVNTNDNNWEERLLSGKGRSYGSEFFIQKEKGRLTGMVSYTLAWSERQFEEVNKGNWFPFKYDRRHDLSLLMEYDLGEKYQKQRFLSLGFTFQSGNNLSIPDTEVPGLVLPGMEEYASESLPNWFKSRRTYDNPNNFKMPAFHHLDIGYTTKLKRTERKNYTWTFSLYNVYSRMNPWYYYKRNDKVRSISVFPIIPSVSFTYKW